MAVFSCLRALQIPRTGVQFSTPTFRCILSSTSSKTPLLHASSSNAVVAVRGMGHKRTIEITPTSFEWRKYKDHLHFYTMLGLIPIGILIGAVNLLIGPGELKDIPEGYEPKPWEYYKSPITQFLARHITESPEKIYERHMHFVAVEKEKIMLRKLEQKVKLLVGEHGQRYDSKRWYYIPSNDQTAQAGKTYMDQNKESEGFK